MAIARRQVLYDRESSGPLALVLLHDAVAVLVAARVGERSWALGVRGALSQVQADSNSGHSWARAGVEGEDSHSVVLEDGGPEGEGEVAGEAGSSPGPGTRSALASSRGSKRRGSVLVADSSMNSVGKRVGRRGSVVAPLGELLHAAELSSDGEKRALPPVDSRQVRLSDLSRNSGSSTTV